MEPTNNQAERDLRRMVLWRKKSHGTQGENGLRYAATISSIVQSLRKQGRRIVDFIYATLRGESPSILA